MNIVKIGKTLIDVIPMTIKLVGILNDLIPEAKKGAEKFKILIAVLRPILQSAEDVADEIIDTIINIIEKIVAGYIKIKKEIYGVF